MMMVHVLIELFGTHESEGVKIIFIACCNLPKKETTEFLNFDANVTAV